MSPEERQEPGTMCPGVGKTYAMLEAARREYAAGRDLVIGYVETHGRKETDTLAEGLPKIARRSLEYRGVTLTEMDLDAVLARKPQLVLVDELAHTNAPGSRHPKRYQDVRELLDAGIDGQRQGSETDPHRICSPAIVRPARRKGADALKILTERL